MKQADIRGINAALHAALGRWHDSSIYGRRVQVLAAHLAELAPEGIRILDVGCGDGRIDRTLMDARSDLEIEGIDVLVRPTPLIPVRAFDGETIPHADAAFDAVMFVDVLHHAADPLRLLREAARVARRWIIIKDHFLSGLLAGPTLRLMDWAGNVRHGVALPYDYWTPQQWSDAFREVGAVREAFRDHLRIYRGAAHLLFDRSLHFAARLSIEKTHGA